jgi:hypothetical protein
LRRGPSTVSIRLSFVVSGVSRISREIHLKVDTAREKGHSLRGADRGSPRGGARTRDRFDGALARSNPAVAVDGDRRVPAKTSRHVGVDNVLNLAALTRSAKPEGVLALNPEGAPRGRSRRNRIEADVAASADDPDIVKRLLGRVDHHHGVMRCDADHAPDDARGGRKVQEQ